MGGVELRAQGYVKGRPCGDARGWCDGGVREELALAALAALARAWGENGAKAMTLNDDDVVAYRWAEGHTERLNELASELVRLKVDVIITHNTPGPLAAKQATSTIPIVFATAGDPVGSGIVTSLARPGGNVTGLSSQATDIASKRLELMREIVPGLHRLAVLAD